MMTVVSSPASVTYQSLRNFLRHYFNLKHAIELGFYLKIGYPKPRLTPHKRKKKEEEAEGGGSGGEGGRE